MATDFAAADLPLATDETMARTTSADGATDPGRWAILGATNFTDTTVGVNVYASTFSNANAYVIARWVDANNYTTCYLYNNQLFLAIYVAGVRTYWSANYWILAPNTWYRLRLTIMASGTMTGELLNSSGVVLTTSSVTNTALATAGALATGKPGFADKGNIASSRYYRNFYAMTPAPEPISLYSGRSMEVRSDTTLRANAAGTYWGQPPSYRGSRFTVPVAGTRNRKSRIAVVSRRNDITLNEDYNVTDSTTVQANVTPRYLQIPR